MPLATPHSQMSLHPEICQINKKIEPPPGQLTMLLAFLLFYVDLD